MKNKARKEKITSILTDARFQTRDSLHKPTIDMYKELYEEAPDRLPPIVVIRIGKKLYVIEGFHRLEAARRAKLKEISVVIIDGDETDGLWHALGSNRHGLQLSEGDMIKAIDMALDSFPNETNVAIAKQVGCTEGYVRKRKKIRTGTISDKEVGVMLDEIRDKYPRFSVDQKTLFRDEVEGVFESTDDENNVEDDDSEEPVRPPKRSRRKPAEDDQDDNDEGPLTDSLDEEEDFDDVEENDDEWSDEDD